MAVFPLRSSFRYMIKTRMPEYKACLPVQDGPSKITNLVASRSSPPSRPSSRQEGLWLQQQQRARQQHTFVVQSLTCVPRKWSLAPQTHHPKVWRIRKVEVFSSLRVFSSLEIKCNIIQKTAPYKLNKIVLPLMPLVLVILRHKHRLEFS